jgi:hypothetical protein
MWAFKSEYGGFVGLKNTHAISKRACQFNFIGLNYI